MKNMVVLIDTNLVLDVLEKRMPFYEASYAILTYCAEQKFVGYIALHSISNLYYILRKCYSPAERRRLLLGILKVLRVANAQYENVINALERNDFSDFEDCLQDECAKQVDADYIVTRNIKDYERSKVQAILPAEFIKVVSRDK